ncbi:MAG: flagellar basal body L-ring protein FlgH [Burkholderiales bacterium]|nr:flagellar basal body L-ring protein FlgH [Burkholderiales bacterium]
MKLFSSSHLAAAALAALALSGCMATAPTVDVIEPTQARPEAARYVPVNNGAIFQAASYRPLYETYRARMVGDIVTVTIDEKISAKQKTTSSISKTGSVSGSIAAVPLIRSDQLGKLDINGKSANAFDGKGTTESSNNFSGIVTCTVVEVLPNGHLIISGEKQIGVAKNVDILKFSGQIDPATIQPGNTVASTQIANVRIEQKGRGAQSEAQGIGWLARFFLNILPL